MVTYFLCVLKKGNVKIYIKKFWKSPKIHNSSTEQTFKHPSHCLGLDTILTMTRLLFFISRPAKLRVRQLRVFLTLISLHKDWTSVVNSTVCSSSCRRRCMLLTICSFSAFSSLTALFSCWIWLCWSCFSFCFNSILLVTADKNRVNLLLKSLL